jgi:hypothetical protein
MGITDKIQTAQGSTSRPFGKRGRQLVRIKSIQFEDPATDPGVLKASFKVDAQLLAKLDGCDPEAEVGEVYRYNEGCRYDDGFARVRRSLVAIQNCKALEDGTEPINESFFKTDNKEENTRRVNAICRNPDQPFRGVLAVVEGIGIGKGKSFVVYEMEVPTEADLEALTGASATAAA